VALHGKSTTEQKFGPTIRSHLEMLEQKEFQEKNYRGKSD